MTSCIVLLRKATFFEIQCVGLNNNFMLFGYNNVYYDPASEYSFENLNETKYFEELIHNLSKFFDAFDRYNFIFFCASKDVEPSSKDWEIENKVIIQTGDITGQIPPEPVCSAFCMYFKTHMRSYRDTRIKAFPLGVPAQIPLMPIEPIRDRKYSVFYSGNFGLNRVELFRSLIHKKWYGVMGDAISNMLKKHWKYTRNAVFRFCSDFSDVYPFSIIRFTKAFQAGYKPREYASILAQSKIVLSPAGWQDAECFRMYEAMRQGCIVINEILPDTDFYKDIPCIQISDWAEADSIIKELLDNPQKMEAISSESFRFYNEVLSPAGVANYIMKAIRSVS